MNTTDPDTRPLDLYGCTVVVELGPDPDSPADPEDLQAVDRAIAAGLAENGDDGVVLTPAGRWVYEVAHGAQERRFGLRDVKRRRPELSEPAGC